MIKKRRANIKVAITADIHLDTNIDNEKSLRFSAFRTLLDDIITQKIKYLIIAGDCFDSNQRNYSLFDSLINKYKSIFCYIIPGNHDYAIKQEDFKSNNIKVITVPSVITIDTGTITFIPYKNETIMSDHLRSLTKNSNFLKSDLLISHGDFINSRSDSIINEYEKGYYMPLYRSDIKRFGINQTILGHIHQAIEYKDENVIYTGSPIGLNITETGVKSYLIYDTELKKVHRQNIDTDIIYYDEVLYAYPHESLEEIVLRLDNIISNWNLDPGKLNNVVLRLKIKGFYDKKKSLYETVKKHVRDKRISLYDDIDASMLDQVDNTNELQIMIKNTIDLISDTQIPGSDIWPEKNEIILEAVSLIVENSGR